MFKHIFKHSGISNKMGLNGLRNNYTFEQERIRAIEEVKNTIKEPAKSCSRWRIKIRALSNKNHVLTEMNWYKARSETTCISTTERISRRLQHPHQLDHHRPLSVFIIQQPRSVKYGCSNQLFMYPIFDHFH